MNLTKSHFQIHASVQRAQRLGQPVVALESTVITHGLPYPKNVALAKDMEEEVRRGGGTPATIALIDGKIHVGVEEDDLENLASDKGARKISVRDFATALTQRENGGTTVAGTMFAAHTCGIQVFATGGIGGVHRGHPFDVSADLPQLSRTPMVVVCAGAKAILDLPATLEYLETYGVPVVGYQTNEFPAFYSPESGLPVSARLDTPADIVAFARVHWALGFRSALLVTQPPPEEAAMSRADMDAAVDRALAEADAAGIRGQAVTPFLLSRVSELTHEASLETNLALLRNNARLAVQIASEFANNNKKMIGFV